MRRFRPLALTRAVAALSVLFLVTGAFAAAPPTLPHVAHRIEAREPLRIVALGSSSTEGIGATAPDRTYPAVLQTILSHRLAGGVAVLNRGIGGQDADDMMRRLPGIIAEAPDLVIWQTGSNDALRGVPIDRFERETRDGIAVLLKAGIDVMLMEPQLSERLANTPGSAGYVASVRSLGRALRVPVVRRYDLMRQWLADGDLTKATMMSGDGLHMGDGGYQKLAEAVADAILAGSNAASPNVAAR